MRRQCFSTAGQAYLSFVGHTCKNTLCLQYSDGSYRIQHDVTVTPSVVFFNHGENGISAIVMTKIQGGPKKVSNYQVTSLNRIKKRH